MKMLAEMSIEEIEELRSKYLRQMGACRNRVMGINKAFRVTLQTGGMPQLEDTFAMTNLVRDWLNIRAKYVEIIKYKKSEANTK